MNKALFSSKPVGLVFIALGIWGSIVWSRQLLFGEHSFLPFKNSIPISPLWNDFFLIRDSLLSQSVFVCVCVCRGGQGAVMIQSKPIRFSQELDSWPEEHSVNAGVCSLPWKWPEQTVHARTVSEVFSPCSLRKCLSFSLFSTFWFAWCFQW